MFTGIVQRKVKISAVEENEQFRRLTLAVPSVGLAALEIGASIAINGCCLTVTAFNATPDATETDGWVRFDVIDETLRLTNLGQLQVGDVVNFERSLTFGSELGGHIVSGHIHGTARLAQRIQDEHNCRLFLELPAKWLAYVLPKGFVAVNGASLTVGEVTDAGFWLHLIPETLALTNLDHAKVGDRLNIEVDQQTMTIVETVKKVLNQQGIGKQ